VLTTAVLGRGGRSRNKPLQKLNKAFTVSYLGERFSDAVLVTECHSSFSLEALNILKADLGH
jgi:hypothetical protein